MQREYRQTARAAAVANTRRRVVEALFSLAQDRLFTEIPLKDVAAAAGVTVQTILRQFGSRAALFDATIAYGVERIRAERAADPTKARSPLSVLMDHYELRGRMVMMMLAQETADPAIARVVEGGRIEHRNWVSAHLADASTTDVTIDLLVVATDVYAWKLLRLDRGLTRRQTQIRMQAMVDRVLAGNEGT